MDTIARLKELLQKRGISLYWLAAHSVIPYSTLKSDVEEHHPLSVDTIGQICKTLGIPLYQFFLTEQDGAGLEKEVPRRARKEQRGHNRPCMPS